MKNKLNFSNKTIEYFKELGIDGEILFQLIDEEIDNFEVILNDEKEKIKIFLNEYKNRNQKIDISKKEKKILENKIENNIIEKKKKMR